MIANTPRGGMLPLLEPDRNIRAGAKKLEVQSGQTLSPRQGQEVNMCVPTQWVPKARVVAPRVIRETVVAVLMALLSAALFTAYAPMVRADTLTVCPSGCQYTSIETALQSSRPGDIIMVGPGEYRENIWLRGGVRVQGAGADKSYLIGAGPAPVVCGYPHDLTNAVLDGFTIRANSSLCAINIDFPHEKQTISNCTIENSVSQWRAGAIYISFGAAPRIINNVIVGNTLTDGQFGGAIMVDAAEPLISGNTFIANSAKNGGAIAVRNAVTNGVEYQATIVDNVFISNTASVRGGAIYVDNASPVIRGNRFLNNTALIGAGICATTRSNALIEANQLEYNRAWGTNNMGGGMAVLDAASPWLDRNIIRWNSAQNGGGIYIQNANPRLTNNVLDANLATQILVSAASPQIVNNTLLGASGLNIVAVDLLASARPSIANNIIAFHTYGVRGDGTTAPTIRFNDTWMSSIANYHNVTAEPNNLNVDPRLGDTASGDYHLQPTSPLIDAGTPDGAPAIDFEGDARPSDGNGDGIARPDIGADEYTASPPTPTPTATPLPLGTVVTVTLQQSMDGYFGAEDTHLYQYLPDSNYCLESLLTVSGNQTYAALVRFDLSPIPSDVTVTRAVLQLYAASWNGSNITLGAYYITPTVNLCQATWNQARSGHRWGVAGANSVTTDRRAWPESTVTTSGIYKWYEFDLTSIVQGWVDGSLPSNGVLLRAAYSGGSVSFSSAQTSVVGRQPKLVVTYRVAGSSAPSPTPTANWPSPTPTPTPTGAVPHTPTATPTQTGTPRPSPTPVTGEITITLQQGSSGYSGAQDTYIYQYGPNTNYCSEDLLKIGYKQQYASLLRFDLSSIPNTAQVTRATLLLYATAWGGTDITVGAYHITRTVNLCQATWNQAQAGNVWAQAGANSTTLDRRPLPESTVTTRGVYAWYQFDLTGLVQGWADGTLPNNGVLLRADYAPFNFYFASAEHSNAALRPRLVITYRSSVAPNPSHTPPSAPTLTPTATPSPSPTPSTGDVTVTLQQGVSGYSGTEDTFVYQYLPDTNYCEVDPLKVGYKQTHAALLRFDLSLIPSDALVTQARLNIYAVAWSGADITLGAYYITRTVTVCQTTWNRAQNGNPWASPGANNLLTDRRSTAESMVTTSGARKWYEFDLTQVVQGWVSGTLPNNGVLLRAEYSTSSFQFASATNETASLRPKLVITYRR